MRFGLSLFGGAVTGLVIAASASSCAATAVGQNLVTRLGTVTVSAQAVATPADVRRVASVFPSVLTALATAAGASQVEFKPLPTTAAGQATAQSGQMVAEYNGYVFANGDASSQGRAVRMVRHFPPQARAYAEGEGNPQTWNLGYASPAEAKAYGFGTTYHVGNVLAVSTAAAAVTPAVQIGGKGYAYAFSDVQAECLYTGGVAGNGLATAGVLADPVVTVNGIKYQQANGLGLASALGELITTTVYQSQTGYAVASAEAYPKTQVGGKVLASAFAYGFGDGVDMATGVTLIEGVTAASATGSPTKQASAKGTGAVVATATGDGLKKLTRVSGSGLAQASVQGTGLRTRNAKSTAVASAQLLVQPEKITIGKLPVISGTATLWNTARTLDLRPLSANGLSVLSGAAVKTVVVSGAAEVVATAIGYNQINDLVKAPASRTSTVRVETRTSIVLYESRTSTV
jgi:hypothetical protein